MYSQIFSNFTDGQLAVTGLLIFLCTFTGTVIWTFLVQKKSFYQDLSLMPFKKRDEYDNRR